MLNKHFIPTKYTIREALKRLDELSGDSLILMDEDDIVKGTLTDGDIRRGLIKGASLDDNVSEIMNANFHFIKEGDHSIASIKSLKEKKIDFVPVLNTQNQLVKIIDLSTKKSIVPVDAVIMAGGRGVRLQPLTNELPKPLLKVGGVPIIERNVTRLVKFGIENINISVNYLGELLEEHFKDGSEFDANVKYVKEDTPLGTIGAVSKIENFSNDTVLVMNSDLLTNIDFEDFYSEFEDSKSDMMVASIPYKVDVPYAILEEDKGRVLSLKEKPTYTYYSNAGIYLIQKNLLKYIPEGECFNATDLMELVIDKGLTLRTYPIKGYWLDIGKMEDFEKAQMDVEKIVF